MSESSPSSSGERLAKVIARAGVCSRRDAEAWITAGRIAVNGAVVKTPAFNVVESDTIAVDGKPLARKQATQLWLYHKPAGLMVTEKDPEGRPTVFEEFSALGLPRVLTVGRLDFNTEGLLLLTNDGGLKRTLELPATGWVRRYRVRAFGSVTQEQLDTLAKGITVEGTDYGPIEAELDSASGSNVWITMGLREGKNREVRNVLGALGLEVNRLIRLSYGPFQLGDLPSGHVEKVKTRILRDQLGKRLADNAGADFDSPVDEEAAQPRRRAPQRPESRPTERDRYTGLRKRPEFKRPDKREAAPRTVHFDDGRPSQTFVPKSDAKRGKDSDPKFRDGRPPREGGFKKRFERDDRPKRDGDERPRPFGKKPFRKDEGEGRGQRPVREKTSDARRPFRRDEDHPSSRRAGPKSDKVFGERPPRRDGGKPFAKGPRREGATGDKPFAKGPRPDRKGGETAGRGPRRDDGKSFARGPRRDGGSPRPRGDAPVRSGKPGPRVQRPDRPRRPRRPEDE